MAKRQFAVIGLGKFGAKLVETLAERGAEIIGVDKKPDLVEKVKKFLNVPVHGDCTDREFLKEHLSNVDVVVVCIGENEKATIKITALLAKMDIGEIIARANEEEDAEILKLVGANKVVLPEEAMAVEVANTILTPAVRKSIPLDPEHEFVAFEVGRKKEFVGKTLAELNLREEFDIMVLNVTTVVEVKKQEKGKGKGKGKDKDEVERELEFTKKWSPGADYRVREGDILGIVGGITDIENFRKKYAKEEKEEETH